VTAFLTHRYATYGEFMERMSGGTIPDTTLAFALSPDGTTLAEATMYGRIWLWDLESSQPRLLRDTEEERPRLPIRDLTFTADGARLIYLDRDAEAILAMDVATGQETVLVETTTKMNPAVSADGAQLAWVDEDEWAIAIWHAALPTSLVSIPLSDLPELESGRGYRRGPLHFTPDGTRLIFAGFYAPDTGQNAILVIDLGQQ
jgi:WD40 repeat protein